MDKNLFIFIMVGLGFLYFITEFVGDIQAEDESYQNSAYQKKHMYDEYQSVDSVGQMVLTVQDTDAKIQLEAWNASPLKDEFLELFPDFSVMKHFVKERIRGERFKQRLLKHINNVEDKFFSGSLNAEQAKQMLGSIN